MYQSVDETPFKKESKGANSDVPIETVQAAHRSGLKGLIVLGVGILGLAVILAARPKETHVNDNSAQIQALETYGKAISESRAALRRARLIDFVQTYPDSPRSSAAHAQLGVLNAAEAKDWAKLSELIYTPWRKRKEKLAALEDYASLWGPDYLGGREAEVAAIRLELGLDKPPVALAGHTLARPIITKNNKPPPDKFPQSIPSDHMLGAPALPKQAEIIVTPEPTRPPARAVMIEPPRVKRASKPRYPSRALREDISARITLLLDIDERGRVRDVRVASAQAAKYQKQFVRAARLAAKRTRFSPQTHDGQPVAASGISKTYVFKVEE